jgi:hypothetical protein
MHSATYTCQSLVSSKTLLDIKISRKLEPNHARCYCFPIQWLLPGDSLRYPIRGLRTVMPRYPVLQADCGQIIAKATICTNQAVLYWPTWLLPMISKPSRTEYAGKSCDLAAIEQREVQVN